MGAADDLATTADLATATKKERQFQVVPVPGHFTRGRWKCWDYKDDKTSQVDEKLDAAIEVSTIIITATTTPEIQPLTQDAILALETTPIKEKESSTIVVTSIAPHPPSIHGTPSSLPEAVEVEQIVINSQLSHTIPEATTVTGQQHIVVGTNDVLIQQVSVGVVPQPPSPPLPSVASAPGMVGRPDGTPTGDESENGGSAEQKLPNIDNKIEQAMDLVKTHLTFAVREEIEVLRQTIHELEQKVSNIEQENQLLRQFAPPHIVADLPQMLALQRQTNAQAAASRAPTMSAVPAPTSAPKIAPEGFCSTSFANTLNNVVADVRQQIRSIPPAPRDPQ